MATPGKFLLPPPNFGKKELPPTHKPHYLTPSGMTLHARNQPPPMYGKRGATTPAKFLQHPNKKHHTEQVPPPPPESRQYCEACDMEMQSESDMGRHRAQHEPCPVQGCKYRGLASVMDKHVSLLHSSGLFDKFKKLSTPEEIAAWREERRKRYPTVANTLQRQRALEQRQRRGERLEANKNRFGKQVDKRRAQAANGNERPKQEYKEGEGKPKRNDRRGNKRKKGQEKRKPSSEPNQKESPVVLKEACKEEKEVENRCCGVIMFKGTGNMSDYEHVRPKKQQPANVLRGLLGMYGTDDEDDEEEEQVEEEIGTLNCQNLKHTPEMGESGQNIEASVVESAKTDHEKREDNEREITEQISPTQHQNPTQEITIDESISHPRPKASLNDVNPATDIDSDAPDEAPIARSSDLPLAVDKIPQPTATTEATIEPVDKREKPSTSKAPLRAQRKSGLDYRKARLRKQNTLLEKLLEPDIRHERNVLLQCVRFVCENEFFGIGQRDQAEKS